MAKSSYTSKDIKVLQEVEHIQLNPSMYIGDTKSPTHLLEEALDNAIDEALAGYAKIIAVVVDTKENQIAVLDNGRGIPLDDNTPVTISAKLFSGGKFKHQKSAYDISSGLHGVGLVAVNALSTTYIVEVYRDKKHGTYLFENAKLKKSSVVDFKGTPPFSTKIQFKPNPKYFESLKPDLSRVRKRLITAAAELSKNVYLVLNVDDKKEVFRLTVDDYFQSHYLSSDNDEFYRLFLSSEKTPEKFNVIFSHQEGSPLAPRVLSSVNILPVDNGGTHIDAFYDLLRSFYSDKAKKLGYNFQPNDVLVGLRAYLTLSLIEPTFAGQTKEKLTNRKTYFEGFLKDLRSQLEDWAEKEPVVLENLLTKFQDYRKSLDTKGTVVNGFGTKRASTKFTKLRDCTSRMGELYIVEGESAGGSLLQCRDTKLHAVLPLKGKSIPNITTKKEILKNKEVEELIRAIGTGVGPHFDISKMRYDKIVCATDADPDGGHIACLITMCIGILLPDIIKKGKYYIAQTPLFAINEKKLFKPLWTKDEVEKAKKAGHNLSRFKGLGELNPNQLKICLLDQPTRHLLPVKYTGNLDDLVSLFSSADEKRKLIGE